MMRLTVLSAIFFAWMALPAAAQTNATDSAYIMFPACKAYVAASVRKRAKPPSHDAGFCAGELRALANLSHVLPPDLRACVPDNVPNAKLVLVAVQYFEAHPEQIHQAFLTLAQKAFRDAWPCKPNER
jgi:hypothetical protein